MTRGQGLINGGKFKSNHCSSMSDCVWSDMKSKSNILKLLDKCPNPKCGCQKIISFTPHQYMLEGGSIKSKLQKISGERKKLGIALLNQV